MVVTIRASQYRDIRPLEKSLDSRRSWSWTSEKVIICCLLVLNLRKSHHLLLEPLGVPPPSTWSSPSDTKRCHAGVRGRGKQEKKQTTTPQVRVRVYSSSYRKEEKGLESGSVDFRDGFLFLTRQGSSFSLSLSLSKRQPSFLVKPVSRTQSKVQASLLQHSITGHAPSSIHSGLPRSFPRLREVKFSDCFQTVPITLRIVHSERSVNPPSSKWEWEQHTN